MTVPYPHLLQPLQVGGLLLKNRIFSAPQGLHAMQDRETWPSEAVIVNMANKAWGGAALVTCHTNSTASRADGSGADTDFDIFDSVSRKFIAQMAEEIHFYDAKASMELNFFFAPAGYDVCDGLIGMDGMPTRAITPELMQAMADSYGQQARLCQELGYDMVMLHMGYQFSLMARFLSPASNRRTDEYGGSAENRARFPVMICDAIKAACGKDYPIEIRMSGEEAIPGGITLEDAQALARCFVGHADLLQVHGPSGAASHCMGFQSRYPFADWAAAVKQAAPGILVEAIGGFQDPADADAVLAQGKADAIVMSRGLIADPNVGVKAMEGRGEDVVPCIKCMRCHDTSCIEKITYRCAVNPTIGLEHKLGRLVALAGASKRVAVIGSGPAGMNAALLAAQRGHTVELFEAADHLGGQLVFADHVDFKAPLARYKNYLIRQIEASPVTVHLSTAATPEQLAGFDVILAALGAQPNGPAFPVAEGTTVVSALDVFGHEGTLGGTVAVIGGGEIGCETALHLARKGHDVVLFSRSSKLAKNASPSYRSALLGAMSRQEGLRVVQGAAVTGVESGAVHFRYQQGRERVFEADSFVLAAGMKARQAEAAVFYGAARQVTLIGDCSAVGNLEGATRTAFAAASQL